MPTGMFKPLKIVKLGLKVAGTETGAVRKAVAPVPTAFDRYAVTVMGEPLPLNRPAVMVTLEYAVVVVQKALGIDALDGLMVLVPMQSLAPRLPVPELTTVVSAWESGAVTRKTAAARTWTGKLRC